MNLGIDGKRALVTGSTAGIGFATARALAREGAKVILNGRTRARVDAAVAAVRAGQPGAHIGGVAADLGTAAGCVGGADPGRDDPLRHDEDGATRGRAGLAETLAGTNVTVNSVLPGPTASEGVGAFVVDLAAARGVDVAEVERDFFASARPSSILRRFATPDEVAAMIAFVCGAPASATTGAALRVDGGVVRAIV